MKDMLSSAYKSVSRPLGQARSLPAACYTDPEVFAFEQKALFLKSWLFAGRTDQVPEAGSYRALDTAGGPALLVRGRDGILRAFANACRHRGSILLEGSGTCGRIQCPYHAWTYHLDGQLAGAPEMADFEGFDPAENGLIPLRMEIWAGFIFLTFDPDAPALLSTLGDLPARTASHRPEEMRAVWSVKLDCRCNWKLLLENAVEAYHTGLVHRTTVGAQRSADPPVEGDWMCLQVLSDRSIGTMASDAPGLPPIEGLDETAAQGTFFTILPPTTQIVFAQDCLWWLSVRPIAADHSALEIGGCFPEATTQLPDFDALSAPYLHRWEAVGREDVGILERQHRALTSVLYEPGLLAPREEQVRRFDEWVVRKLLDELA